MLFRSDGYLQAMIRRSKETGKTDFSIKDDGSLWCKDRLCVPDNLELKKKILKEVHSTPYTAHPGNTKMYHDLKSTYWWTNMKRKVAEYVAHCLTCQQVKTEHQRPAGPLQSLEIPQWKWEYVTMDFMTGLPRTPKGHDAIWMIVDRLTKTAHFLPYGTGLTLDGLAKLYVAKIV